MTVLKSVLCAAALLLPVSSFAQPLNAQEKEQVHELCLGFSMISKGIMQARQQGEAKDDVKVELAKAINKGDGASLFLTESTSVLLEEAYTVPVATDPKKAQDIALAFGVATYTQCMERMPPLIEKHRAQNSAQQAE